jgi:hydrogenase expression/formation protein HypD
MKFVDEFRDPILAKQYTEAIARLVTKPWKIMEICGGQTHAIVKYGIDQLLPSGIELIHGPGCPVCVTPIDLIDQAIAIAQQPLTILCSFGDMLRVPGSKFDLLSIKAQGCQIKTVYSPLDALALAKENPDQEIVFFGVGFETTAPATAMAVYQAAQQHIFNFSLLPSHVLVPPAIEAILSSPHNQVQGFLLAGHVCTVMGYEAYHPLAERYQVPLVVTGFEPIDVLQGIYLCLQQLESGRREVENQYRRSVQAKGNSHAQALLKEVFVTIDQAWRGLGTIPKSGLDLAPAYQAFSAVHKFNLTKLTLNSSNGTQPSVCISGEILQGLTKPAQCPAFGTTCTPEHPLGAPMVSSEGACAAYYRYRGNQQPLSVGSGSTKA